MRRRAFWKKTSAEIRLVLPSRYGYEKIAMDAAATMAQIMGFPSQRVEDLRTAVSEACINAMEHGNKLIADNHVEVLMMPERQALHIEVRDCGGGFDPKCARHPNLEKKLSGEESPRGWGLFLIERLVDRVDFKTVSGDGHITKLTMNLAKP